MSTDTVTLLAALGGKNLTKRIQRARDGEFLVAGYDRAFEFAVTERPVTSLIDLGRLLASLEKYPAVCVIRGRPLPRINRDRCRRLLYPMTDDDGQEWEATFEASPRRWIALDFDDLPVPTWNLNDLARRRAAMGRDRAEHHVPMAWSDDSAELIELDLAGDLDPAPIDAVKDWPLVVRAAVSALPPEFADASAWWTMTSSAGLKPGVRLRLWYWLDQPVDDQACKRWLSTSPVDRSLFSPVQAHYTAWPIFADPADDPVPQRSGWWWRHTNTVAVPELPEPEPVDVDQAVTWQPVTIEPGKHQEIAQACLARADLTDWERDFCTKVAGLASLTTAQAEALAKIADPLPARAQAYAKIALRAVATASAGTRHPTLMAVGVRLYSLAHAGLIDAGDVTRGLLAAAEAPLSAAERRQRGMRQGGRPSENEQACDWARARARTAPDLPEGFRS